MKKIMCALAVLLAAALFSFSGCSPQKETKIDKNLFDDDILEAYNIPWLKNLTTPSTNGNTLTGTILMRRIFRNTMIIQNIIPLYLLNSKRKVIRCFAKQDMILTGSFGLTILADFWSPSKTQTRHCSNTVIW